MEMFLITFTYPLRLLTIVFVINIFVLFINYSCYGCFNVSLGHKDTYQMSYPCLSVTNHRIEAADLWRR